MHNNGGYIDINHLKDDIVKQPTRRFSLHPLMTIFCNPLSYFPAVFFIMRLGTTVSWPGVEHGPRPAGSRLWSDDRDCFGLWPQNTQTWSDVDSCSRLCPTIVYWLLCPCTTWAPHARHVIIIKVDHGAPCQAVLPWTVCHLELAEAGRFEFLSVFF